MRAHSLSSLLMIAASSAVASSAPQSQQESPLHADIAQARREAAAAENAQRLAERAADEARNTAEKLQLQQLAAAQAIIAEEARITSADAQAALARAQLNSERRELARQHAPVSSLLAGLALMGRRPALAMVAGASSPEELVRVKLLVEAIAPAVQARTAALSSRLERTEALARQSDQARQRALAARQSLEQRKVELARLESRALQLAQARGGQALGAADLATARGERAAELERQDASSVSARASGRELARYGPAPARPGSSAPQPPLRYVLPVAARVVDGVGSVSDSGVRSRGITLASRRGASVAAPARGTIIFAGPFRDYDGIVIIDHGGGWKSVLVNVGSTAAKGSRLTAGQPLGTALGAVEVQLQHNGNPASAALIAGSSATLSNEPRSD